MAGNKFSAYVFARAQKKTMLKNKTLTKPGRAIIPLHIKNASRLPKTENTSPTVDRHRTTLDTFRIHVA